MQADKRLAAGRRATILGFGVSLLFPSFWYHHHIGPARTFSHHTAPAPVGYGPLCMNIDQLRAIISLPQLAPNDQVVVCTKWAATI